MKWKARMHVSNSIISIVNYEKMDMKVSDMMNQQEKCKTCGRVLRVFIEKGVVKKECVDCELKKAMQKWMEIV
jgi:hypothetical protein